MGQYGGKETLPYLDPDSKQPEAPNAFDISTLHELGHSVDDRFGLMNKYGSGDAAGGWATERVEDVTSRYVDRFKTGVGKAHSLRDDILTGSVLATFNAGAVSVAGGATPEEKKALAGLLATCASRVAGSPWEKEDSIGGRSYHRNGKVWVSYSTAARGKALNVSLYQWRSPAEFFAELYAWTFYNSKPPPGPVQKELKSYMYGGDAAQPPAKH